MIAIVDYGVGNLFSLKASLAHLALDSVVTGDADTLRAADRVILPGVGAFGDAAQKLRATGLVPVLDALVAEGKPFLGICVGMQLLFERSSEYGEHAGLGYLAGHIEPLAPDLPPGLKVPHIGWNALRIVDPHEPLLRDTPEGAHVYFVHSYYAKGCDAIVRAYADYSVPVPGVVRKGNVCGTQFHPEKSGAVGLSMLRAFAEVNV